MVCAVIDDRSGQTVLGAETLEVNSFNSLSGLKVGNILGPVGSSVLTRGQECPGEACFLIANFFS